MKAGPASGGGKMQLEESKGGSMGKSMKQGGSVSPVKTFSKPKGLTCYICGREFGTASLEIHLKTCKKKWEDEESKKPKGQRRPCPEAPKNFDELLTGNKTQGALDDYNDAAYKEYNDKALMACPNCARTFLPDRLDVHLRSCNKAHGKNSTVP